MKVRFLLDDETDTPFAFFLEQDLWAAERDSPQADFEAKMRAVSRHRQKEFTAWLAGRGIVPTWQTSVIEIPDVIVFEMVNAWGLPR